MTETIELKGQLFRQADEAEEAGDIDAAVKLVLQVAVLGDADAQYRLGLLYDEHVRPLQPKMVRHWYVRAFRGGNSNAAWNLALHFQRCGRKRWYRFWMPRAEEMGDKDAALEMARIRSDMRVEAAGSAKENVVHFDYELFMKAHDSEERGHLETALRLFEQLALRGDADAQNRLARLYEDQVSPRQPQKAIYWDIRSYRSGNACAAWNLAMHYVPRGNRRWYRFWMQKAADLGDDDAVAEMAKIAADPDYITLLPWQEED